MSPVDRRSPLNRDQVVAAAVALADEDGIAAVSMRKVAGRLGVEAMSLYHHVANKDDLLDGMVDAVTAEFTVPTDTTDWRAVVRGRCHAARAALRRHPWAVGLMDSRSSPGLATLRHHEAVLASLRGAGFSVAGAAHAFALIDSFLYGFALQERNLPFATGDDVAKMAEELVDHLPPDEFPCMIEMATQHVMVPGYDFGDEFEPGLELVLDALERARPTT
ncbi:MAG: TetR/AcrR family transcriptional regulator C-terminal domain-containing protein [Acidimicrobiales bacterium]|nr:TetR/AcrR family transcriptional regulator C-terminal domain-containing protein [Acidimicrobiales bacterium]